jgi:uncharacterized protein
MSNSQPLEKRKLRLADDVFTLSKNGKFYLFAPRIRTFSAVNKDMFKFLELCDGNQPLERLLHRFNLPKHMRTAISELFERRILLDEASSSGEDLSSTKTTEDGFGLRLSLFPSTACNLRCRYCYADGGDHPKFMAQPIYLKAMDYFFNSISNGEDHVHLSLHGGGEPTINFPLLTSICSEFSKRAFHLNLKPKISITSNGTFGKEVREWAILHSIGISFSLDGPSEIQNLQRPFRSGAPSFDVVMDNIRFFVESGRQIGIRSTVTSRSVHSMKDTIEMAKQSGIAAVHFEPLFETRRSTHSGLKPPSLKEFADNLLACFLTGLEYDIEVTYSALRCYDYPQMRFCSACGYNFGVTVDGDVTCCYEVLQKTDPASDCFFIGKINLQDDKVDLHWDRINYLRTRTTGNMHRCRDCFLRFNCAGDCLIKAYRATRGDLFGIDHDRCWLAKRINEKIICWIADGFIEPRNGETRNVFSYKCEEFS